MDFGGFIGYGKGVPVGLVKEKLNGKKMYDGCARPLCKVDTMLVGLRNRDLAEYSQVTTI